MMENTSDLVQIMQLTAGAGKMSMKIAKDASLLAVQLLAALYHRNQQVKTGGVSFQKLVHTKGTELEVLHLPIKDKERLKEAFQELEKRGVLFNSLEDLNTDGKYTDIMYHVSDAPKVKAFMESWKTMPFAKEPEAADQTLNASDPSEQKSAREEGLPYVTFVNDYANQYPEKEFNKLKNEVVKEVQSKDPKQLSPEELLESKKAIKGMEAQGKNTITIDKSLFRHQDEDYFISRIPKTDGKKEFLVLAKADVNLINNGKTAVAGLLPAQTYAVVGEDGKYIRSIKGSEIYNHYDKAMQKEKKNALEKVKEKMKPKKLPAGKKL